MESGVSIAGSGRKPLLHSTWAETTGSAGKLMPSLDRGESEAKHAEDLQLGGHNVSGVGSNLVHWRLISLHGKLPREKCKSVTPIVSKFETSSWGAGIAQW